MLALGIGFLVKWDGQGAILVLGPVLLLWVSFPATLIALASLAMKNREDRKFLVLCGLLLVSQFCLLILAYKYAPF